jgi:hemoglobin
MTAGATLYERMGGADALRKLVDDFYDLIENDPDGEILNLLHLRGHGVAHSRIEQFNFLSGFFGGPRLYTEKHGHSDVREMHRHVEVGPAERDAWLLCMQRAVDGMAFERDVSERLMKHFRVVANVLEIENRKNEKTRAAAG